MTQKSQDSRSSVSHQNANTSGTTKTGKTRETHKTRKKRKRAGTNRPAAVVTVLIFLALLMVLLLLYRTVADMTAVKAPEATAVASYEPAPTLPPSTLVAEAFGEENGYRTYSHQGVTARLGVDVSSHQGGIDWDAVKEAGVDFAIVRVGYRGYADGTLLEDDLAETNCTYAHEAGLDLGMYVFSQALTEQEAVEEAKLAIRYADAFGIEYPIYYDWEPIDDGDARTATISATEVTANAIAFCRTVELAGYESGVYFNLSMAAHYYHLYDLMDYHFWLAEYQPVPSYPYIFDTWQYSSDGSVPGIYTRVDMNLIFPEAK